MKKTINFQDYKVSNQTIDTINYNNDEVTKVEINNAYSLCRAIQIDKGSKAPKGEVKLGVENLVLEFTKTDVSGVSLGIPTISSLRDCDKEKIEGRIYPFEGTLFNEQVDFSKQEEWRGLTGISKSIQEALIAKQTNNPLPEVELALRSSSGQFGHVNVFRLTDIYLTKNMETKEYKNIPTNNEGKIRGLDSKEYDKLYKAEIKSYEGELKF